MSRTLQDQSTVSNSNILSTPFSSVALTRFPQDTTETLRAWDAADEYLLNELFFHDDKTSKSTMRILLVNDQFGALSTSLYEYELISWSDSKMTQVASQHQRDANGISAKFDFLPSTNNPSGYFNVVLIKLPKSLQMLEYQLIKLRSVIDEKTLIIAGGMVKHWTSSAQDLFQKIIGRSYTTKAVKKARLLYSTLNSDRADHDFTNTVVMDNELQLVLSHEANVYGQKKLDVGARLIISIFDQLPNAPRIVDLACGNGVLGIMALRQQPQASVSFLDESYMAVKSAQENVKKNIQVDDHKSTFIVSDGFDQANSTDAVDLILCNPPFHQEHTITDLIAWKLFSQSYSRLKKGGELWVVGNRHLNYHVKLKRLFKHTRLAISNKKFTVIVAKK